MRGVYPYEPGKNPVVCRRGNVASLLSTVSGTLSTVPSWSVHQGQGSWRHPSVGPKCWTSLSSACGSTSRERWPDLVPAGRPRMIRSTPGPVSGVSKNFAKSWRSSGTVIFATKVAPTEERRGKDSGRASMRYPSEVLVVVTIGEDAVGLVDAEVKSMAWDSALPGARELTTSPPSGVPGPRAPAPSGEPRDLGAICSAAGAPTASASKVTCMLAMAVLRSSMDFCCSSSIVWHGVKGGMRTSCAACSFAAAESWTSSWRYCQASFSTGHSRVESTISMSGISGESTGTASSGDAFVVVKGVVLASAMARQLRNSEGLYGLFVQSVPSKHLFHLSQNVPRTFWSTHCWHMPCIRKLLQEPKKNLGGAVE